MTWLHRLYALMGVANVAIGVAILVTYGASGISGVFNLVIGAILLGVWWLFRG